MDQPNIMFIMQVIYLSKPNNVPILSPQALKNLGCQVITVGRIAETELLYNSLKTGKMSKHWFSSEANFFGKNRFSRFDTFSVTSLLSLLDKNGPGPLIHIVEDSAILDASLDMITSRKVREKIKSGENIETLVGNKIQEYVNTHKIGSKVIFLFCL